MHFFSLSFGILASLTLAVTALPATIAQAGVVSRSNGVHTFLVSPAEFTNWLSTTDANLTFIGKPITQRDLESRQSLNTMVTYCTNLVDNVCGGTCTVYNGGPTCLQAGGTNCLAATNNVGFCDGGNCDGSCNELASCGTPLDNNFCATPGTGSIVVGA
ncbi:hypothetical protein BDZ97DRAFT_1849387 [Flammula alnicola]|nr:hypothetical protein BDZ97DRAFT_1849384 [Flammula alnicola]KAF8956831.1 hypothetical protein BDZ97DRAFT_1849387 [Flammula alnicola]